jgi:hypothetical protein
MEQSIREVDTRADQSRNKRVRVVRGLLQSRTTLSNKFLARRVENSLSMVQDAMVTFNCRAKFSVELQL